MNHKLLTHSNSLIRDLAQRNLIAKFIEGENQRLKELWVESIDFEKLFGIKRVYEDMYPEFYRMWYWWLNPNKPKNHILIGLELSLQEALTSLHSKVLGGI